MEKYQTKDLYIASFLYAKDVTFTGINKEGRNCTFLFEDSDTCKKLVLLQFQGKAEVNARAFIEAIKTLKSLIFSEIGR